LLQQVLTILIGMLGGVSVGIQSPIANGIGQRLGVAASTFIVHVSGVFFSVLYLLLRGGENIEEVRTLPWWMFGVGAFGVLILATVNYTIPRIGVAATTTLIVAGQLVAGLLIDQFGWLGVAMRPVDGTRVLAILFLLAGGYLMTRSMIAG
jgi:transporter family-2 protein